MPIIPQFSRCFCIAGPSFLVDLLFLLILALLLEAYWRLYGRRIRKYFQKQKPKKPRQLRPRSPRDCEACQAGIEVRFFRPRTDVVPYREVKSRRGRKKTVPTEGYACPNVKSGMKSPLFRGLKRPLISGKNVRWTGGGGCFRIR